MVIYMKNADLNNKIEVIKNELGSNSPIVIKNIFIGRDKPLDAAIIYLNTLVSKDIIDRDILNPLMLHVQEDISHRQNIADYLCKKYIPMSNTVTETDINKIVDAIKRGMTAIVIHSVSDFIVLGTAGGEYRAVSEPDNESSIRGTREGFVENLDTNISIMKRRIKDKNLIIEKLIVGRRSQTDVAILYIDDVVNRDVLDDVRNRISKVDVDAITGGSMLIQYIEKYPYTIFPQVNSSERPDVVEGNLMEGKLAIMVDGTPHVNIAPSALFDFFQSIDGYNLRTIVASFTRILRVLAAIIVITLPSIYLTLIKFNVELIPVKFVTPIVAARMGIALTPFLEILSMELTVEFLREGGLFLPVKVAQTLSIVGGIIIGEMVIQSKIVSPTTLFIIGFTTIATFLIPTYDMSLVIRLIKFPMLIIANFLGILGIAAASFFLLVHLSSLDSFGTPYFVFKLSDMKDVFIRAPLWKMNKRPQLISPNDSIRQTDFRKKFRRSDDEQNTK